MFWGDRCGTIVDPDGYAWMVGTHIAEPTPQEMKKAMKKQAAGAPPRLSVSLFRRNRVGYYTTAAVIKPDDGANHPPPTGNRTAIEHFLRAIGLDKAFAAPCAVGSPTRLFSSWSPPARNRSVGSNFRGLASRIQPCEGGCLAKDFIFADYNHP
jgi:hypothetical protein